MSQDTRKDPRAKVLTMTVRYKSATLDEFIEHHSYDVSRGGMFIKTPSPFPPGTLLKFEVKIAADQKLIQGVGRVVWKRDSESADARPAGMGVKFIKIDDASRKVIDALVESRGDVSSTYETGGGDGGALPAVASAPAPALAGTPAPVSMRKATMIGLGAINPSSRPSTSTPVSAPADELPASFFPATKSQADMPPPEDRTVMKQAAELLQDALRETGSSIDEVAEAPKSAEPPAKPAEPEAPPRTKRSEPPSELKSRAGSESKSISARPAGSASIRPAASDSARPMARKSAVSASTTGRRVSVPVEAPSEKSGGGRVVVIALAIAAAAGVVLLVNRNSTPPEPTPATASAEPAAPPSASETPAPVDTAAAAPGESVAPPSGSASAPASASAAPAASSSAPHAVSAPPAPVAPRPAPVLQARPAPKPKRVVAPVEPSVDNPTAPSEPTAEKPTTPAPRPAAPTRKPELPAPKPKPAEPAGDNPY